MSDTSTTIVAPGEHFEQPVVTGEITHAQNTNSGLWRTSYTVRLRLPCVEDADLSKYTERLEMLSAITRNTAMKELRQLIVETPVQEKKSPQL